MQSPPLDPPVDDLAPTAAMLTGYDERHLVTYLRLLDADAEGAHWEKARAAGLGEPSRTCPLDDGEGLPPPPRGWRTALTLVPCAIGNAYCRRSLFRGATLTCIVSTQP